MMIARESASTKRYGKVGDKEEGEAAEIEAGIAAAKESLAKAPGDQVALRALKLWLDRQVEHEIKQENFERALQVAEGGVTLVERQLESEPDRAEWLYELAAGLARIGYIHKSLGSLSQAYAAYDESLRTRRYLLSRETDRAERLRDVSVILNKIGDIHAARGNPKLACGSYVESVQIMQRLLEHEPERVDWLHDLSVSLDNLGDAYKSLKDMPSAFVSYEESLRIRQSLLRQKAYRADWLNDLSVSFDKIGGIHLARGDLTLAYQARGESVQIMRGLLEREPDRLEWAKGLSLSLENVGDVHVERGDFVAAQKAYDESFRIRQSLLDRYPTNQTLRHDVVLSVARQAHLATAMGRTGDALFRWREVLAKLKSLAKYESQQPDWIRQVAAARKEIVRLEAINPAKPSHHKKPKRDKKKR